MLHSFKSNLYNTLKDFHFRGYILNLIQDHELIRQVLLDGSIKRFDIDCWIAVNQFELDCVVLYFTKEKPEVIESFPVLIEFETQFKTGSYGSLKFIPYYTRLL